MTGGSWVEGGLVRMVRKYSAKVAPSGNEMPSAPLFASKLGEESANREKAVAGIQALLWPLTGHETTRQNDNPGEEEPWKGA
jgi:hypothetical protein